MLLLDISYDIVLYIAKKGSTTMKKLISILLILSLFTVCIIGSAIADTDYTNAKIIVNGIRIALFDNDNNLLQPANIDGVLYIPIESLITNIGGSYQYDSATETITINLNNYTITEVTTNTEDDLESKAFSWSSVRDSRIDTCKKVANAFMSYAKNYFKNPSSIRLEKAYNGITYYILDISAENSMGGRTRTLYDVDTETYEVSEAGVLGNSMVSLASELTGDDFEWFASLFK